MSSSAGKADHRHRVQHAYLLAHGDEDGQFHHRDYGEEKEELEEHIPIIGQRGGLRTGSPLNRKKRPPYGYGGREKLV
jgi:hypothetical protein